MRIERLKQTRFINVVRLGLAFFLILSSFAIFYSTARNDRSAQRLADQSLENTAVALSSSAEVALRRDATGAVVHNVKEIFPDRVVAYAMIVDARGNIIFHTNPRLIGQRLAREERDRLGSMTQASGRRIILGTGLPGYEYHYPLHLADGSTEWLRIILHTTPADRIVSDAKRMWWVGLSVLVLLWTFGILLERVLTRFLNLSEELEHKKHLAVIGQMTAVLAHEIRNALGSIKGYAQLVNEKLASGDPHKTPLANVLQATARIEFLVQELLQFSREESLDMKRLDVIPLLKNAMESVGSGFNGTWRITGLSSAFVKADEEKLCRVFVNAIQNAIQAMGNQGTLDMSVHSIGRWIQVKIEDSGPGISPQQKSLLFTPFYTTKTNGTGLGLAYSRKVMEAMKGDISLENRDRTPGAVLTVRIPKAGDG